MPHILFVFASRTTAERRVAGIPAAARAAHALASLQRNGGIDGCFMLADAGWTPGPDVMAECSRLAPSLSVGIFSDADGDVIPVRGEAFVAAVARQRADAGRDEALLALSEARMRHQWEPCPAAAAVRDLDRAERHLLAATGKSGDGVVSRYVNRPISRAISRLLLRVPNLTPAHASLGTAVLGLAMTFALLFGGDAGLIAGAVLFQAASIFDGVDGEMARATFRTSDQGATLDSVIDACTNLAFIAGVTVNVGFSGDLPGAAAGAIALATLATGLLMIGKCAEARGEPTNFDVVKRHLRRDGRRSVATEWLIHLTMRDFFAAACATMLLAGLTHELLVAFAVIAAGWLVVTVIVLGRIAPEAPASRMPQDRTAAIATENRGTRNPLERTTCRRPPFHAGKASEVV